MIVVFVMLLLPATAFGQATRFAEPNGNGPEPCLVGDPCSLPIAVGGTTPGSVVDGDDVVVLPGTYNETENVFAFDDITVHGQAGQPRPLINSSAATAFGANDPGAATFRRLEVNHTGSNQAFGVFPGNLDDVIARSQNGTACLNALGTMTITNSVCWTEGVGALGVTGIGNTTTVLRNVTAVTTGTSNTDALRFSSGTGETTTVTATNVIAQATADPPEVAGISDIAATASGAGATTTVNMDHSNYEDVFTLSLSGGTATVTPNTTSGNQGAVPLLADPATGDFHQLLGSPTIDAGLTDPANGTTDIDGQPRQIGTSTDIGADEFPDADSDGIPDSSDACPSQAGPASNNGCPIPVPEGPTPDPPAGDTAAPDTTIASGPKGKTKKKSATFTFTGTDARAVSSFQCKLDDGAFQSCTSPKTYSGLKKGSHTVSVRAVDGAGNVDPTPATRTWKVKKKKKKN